MITSIQSMKKLWKSRPRLKARPHPMAMASAAKAPLWVSEISTSASRKPSAQAAIGTPGQRMTSRFSGLSGRKLMGAHNVSRPIFDNISATDSRPDRCPGVTGGLDVELFDVEVAQLRRRLQAVIDQHAEQAQDVAGPVEVDAVLPGQGLNRPQLADVALRKTATIGRGPLGNDEAEVLIHHQRAWMGLQNFRCHADGVDRLVQRESRLCRRPTRYSFSQSSIPSERLVGVVRALMRYSCAPRRRPRATRSSSS